MIKIYLAKYDSLDVAKQSILTRYAQDSRHSYSLGYEPSGEPKLLSDTAPKRYVSISHTDGMLAMAFCSSKVGVDIERIDRTVSPKICDSIEMWTRIEAYAKWTGNGLSKDILACQLPEDKIQTIIFEDYVISVCCVEREFEINTLS